MDKTDMILESENETIIELVDLIGAEHTWKLVETFSGGAIYIPAIESVERIYRDKNIYDDFSSGMSYKKLRVKYGLTDSGIRKIIKSEMEKRKTDK